MARIIWSPRAERDLVEIIEYTREEWGDEQALEYTELIEAALTTLADDPDRGRLRMRGKIRDFAIRRRGRPARHVLFYRVNDAGDVELLRVLHDAMDAKRHLPK